LETFPGGLRALLHDRDLDVGPLTGESFVERAASSVGGLFDVAAVLAAAEVMAAKREAGAVGAEGFANSGGVHVRTTDETPHDQKDSKRKVSYTGLSLKFMVLKMTCLGM
jgi:hypothetical protein